jgi:Na+-translocating ferredoxin:NAD+ oxidoreductase RnfG subunit
MRFIDRFKNQLIWLGVSTLIVAAVFIGKTRSEQSKQELIQQHFLESQYQIQQVKQNKWFVYDPEIQIENLLYLGKAYGYNGEIEVFVQVDKDSLIQKIFSISHQETPSYYDKIIKKHFFEQFQGKKVAQFLTNKPVNAVSGATITSNAIIEATKNGYAHGENISISETKYQIFGILELIVLFLFTAGILISKLKSQKLKKTLLWISIFISILFLGFIYNQPISYSRLTALLLGNFPDWHKEFYFYILVIGSVILVLLSRKNIYCHSVCPFGAAQEILAKTGKAKAFRPAYYKKLKFIQRTIALSAILVALVMNNPVIASYEVFSAFFQLTANFILFGVLFIVIILSLFIKRPWCHFMCPIDSVFDYVKLTRKSITELWKK